METAEKRLLKFIKHVYETYLDFVTGPNKHFVSSDLTAQFSLIKLQGIHKWIYKWVDLQI